MANSFGTDILIQAEDPNAAAAFYIEQLGFTLTGESRNMLHLEGPHINLYIERGPALGPILEVMVPNVAEAKGRLLVNVTLLPMRSMALVTGRISRETWNHSHDDRGAHAPHSKSET